MPRTLKYLSKLPSKARREREIAELISRLNDPNDPYRGACWATSDEDAAEVTRDVE